MTPLNTCILLRTKRFLTCCVTCHACSSTSSAGALRTRSTNDRISLLKYVEDERGMKILKDEGGNEEIEDEGEQVESMSMQREREK